MRSAALRGPVDWERDSLFAPEQRFRTGGVETRGGGRSLRRPDVRSIFQRILAPFQWAIMSSLPARSERQIRNDVIARRSPRLDSARLASEFYQLEVVAADLCADTHLRNMPPVEAATEWLRPVEACAPEHFAPALGRSRHKRNFVTAAQFFECRYFDRHAWQLHLTG